MKTKANVQHRLPQFAAETERFKPSQRASAEKRKLPDFAAALKDSPPSSAATERLARAIEEGAL
jgi:hypothetical protein